MRTINGRKIQLDPTKIGPDPEKSLKVIVWASSIMPILFLYFPAYWFADQSNVPNAGSYFLLASFLTFLGMATYLSRLVKAEDPTIQHKSALLFAHFRLCFASSVLFFVCAGLTTLVIGAVMLFWLYAEIHHFATLRRVSDDALCAAYPVRFSELENGDLLYDSRGKVDGIIKEPWYYTKTAEAVLIPITIIVGGFLYVRSFTLRDDFEPRLLIVGSIMLFVAFIVRSFITHVALDIRAVKLKAQGKF